MFKHDRIGLNGEFFKFYKFRTMKNIKILDGNPYICNKGDKRITTFGKFFRKYSLDEFPQIINIIKGEMSFVGPRPNVIRETSLYSKEEQNLLSVRPGITDFASICFSDEGEILKGSNNPDLDYNQLISYFIQKYSKN